jgi:glycosyltransferase involved in cell wall biosynthesis
MIMHELLVEGGGERQCVSLARELVHQGHSVTLYTSAYDRQRCFPEVCRDLTIVDVGRGRFRWLSNPRLLRAYLDMRRLERAVTEPFPVWNPHHWPAEWGAVRLKKKLGGTVVWTCNDVPELYAQAQPGRSGFLRRLFYRLAYSYDRAQARKMDLTVFLSHWAEGEFKAIYPVPTAVVRSGADPHKFRPGGDGRKVRDRFAYSFDDFVLLWLGIFMPHRRLQDAIEAVALLKERGRKIKLLLAGSGDTFPEYFAQLQSLVAQRQLAGEVTFAGKVADQEINDFYSACDAFLFPNENQTWGLAVLEAMACGRPVLVSQGAAIHEILTDGKDALLFPARDPAALAQKIETLVTHPQERATIAAAGLQLIRTEYNWRRFAEKMADVFEQVAGAHAAERLDIAGTGESSTVNSTVR